MAFPATPYSAWSINRRINPSYAGNLFQIYTRTGATTYQYVDIGFDANGDVDRQAIIDAVNATAASKAYLWIVYDQYANGNDLSVNGTDGNEVFLLYEDGVGFTEDAEGLLKANKADNAQYFKTNNNLQGITTGSFHLRGAIYPDRGDASLTPTASAIVSSGSNTAYAGYVENSTSTSINTSIGSPAFANNGSALVVTERQDLFNGYADGVLRTIGINNMDFSVALIDDFQFPKAKFQYIYQFDFQEAVLYDSDQSANNADINAEFEAYYEPVDVPSVTFTDALDAPIVGADVTWIAEDPFVATDPQWTNAQVVGSNYVTDGQGVATYDPNTDPAVDDTKVYTAIARYLEWDGTKWVPTMGAITAQNNVDLTPPA